MADEAPFSSILGEGEEHGAFETDSQPRGLDAAAAAVAIGGSGADPLLALEAARYFQEQRRLVKIQIEHLHEQRTLKIRHLRMRQISDFVRVAIQIGLGLLVTGFLACLLVFIWNAARYANVVVEAFQVPPSLAARGVTAEVVAANLLDDLALLQAATRASGARLPLQSAWTGGIKLEIPETGISIGQLQRLIHEEIGKDIHVAGNLIVQPDGGVVLTVRGDGIPAHTFAGSDRDIGKLSRQGAEYVYGTAEPVAFAQYLIENFRIDDGLTFVEQAYPHAGPTDRPVLGRLWGDFLRSKGRREEAASEYEMVLRLDPTQWVAWEALANTIIEWKGAEAALPIFERMHRAAKDAPSTRRPSLRFDRLENALFHDAAAYIADVMDDNNSVDGGTTPAGAWLWLASAEAARHDTVQAALWLAEADPSDPWRDARRGRVKGRLLLESDPVNAIAPLQADLKFWSSFEAYRMDNPTEPCLLALAYARAGKATDAHSVLALVSKNGSNDCGDLSGDVMEALDDRVGADAAFAKTIAAEPSFPSGYEMRGEALLKRSNFLGAINDFAAANQRGPHWADPLKFWGDALAREGKWSEALAKYGEALKYAPNWHELQQARDEAAEHA